VVAAGYGRRGRAPRGSSRRTSAINKKTEIQEDTKSSSATVELKLGRYRLLRQIGSGRLGDIYEARDAGAGTEAAERPVSLQILSARLTTNFEYMKRIRRGVITLQAGGHPNVLRIERLERDESMALLILEPLDGVSLRSVLDEGEPLPVAEAAAVLRCVGEALVYLHSRSMVHGRVTPENVFLAAGLDVKLLDIVPLPSVVRSTPLRRGLRSAVGPTVSDDIFDLACLMYELLAGRHPYAGLNVDDAVRAGRRPERLPVLTTERWHALSQALLLEPQHGYASVAEFLTAFGFDGSEHLSGRAFRARAAPVPLPPAAQAPAIPTLTEMVSSLAATDADPDDPDRGRAEALGEAAAAAAAEDRRTPARSPPAVARPALLLGAASAVAYSGRSHAGRYAAGAGLGLLLLAGAWFYFERPQSGLIGWLPADDSRVAVSSTPAASGLPPAEGSGPALSADLPAAWEAAPGNEAVPDPETNAGAGAGAGGDVLQVAIIAPAAAAIGRESAEAVTPAQAPPQFFFSEARLSVRESDGALRLTIRREGDLSRPASVSFSTADGSALAGQDYVAAVDGTERFAAAESERTIFVPLINDGLVETTERFVVRLDDGAAVSGLTSLSIDIVDDD
jgi:hypothetical protein